MRRLSLKTAIALGVALWALGFGYTRAQARTEDGKTHSSNRKLSKLPVGRHGKSETKPEPPASPLGQSYAAEKRGDHQAAARALRPAVKARPDDYFLRVRLAFLESSAGDFAAAAKDYALAAKLDDASIEALLGQQQALIQAKNYTLARAVGKRILERDAGNYLAQSRLAWTSYNLRRYQEAEAAYSDVLRAYPADVEMTLGLAYTELERGKRKQAIARFRQVVERVPQDERAKKALASLGVK
jgi:tetratricopeptide (TPR) repeat protein